MNEADQILKRLSRSAGIVMQSLNSGNYIPEFRYKNLEKDIKAAREHLRESADAKQARKGSLVSVEA